MVEEQGGQEALVQSLRRAERALEQEAQQVLGALCRVRAELSLVANDTAPGDELSLLRAELVRTRAARFLRAGGG